MKSNKSKYINLILYKLKKCQNHHNSKIKIRNRKSKPININIICLILIIFYNFLFFSTNLYNLELSTFK